MVSLYNTGLELANLLLGSDLLNQSWEAISKLQKQNLTLLEDPSLPFSVKNQIYESPSKGSIIAFVSSPNCAVNHLKEEFRELISSDQITSFDFLRTRSNTSSISIHKAAFALFASLEKELSLLKQQENVNLSYLAMNIAKRAEVQAKHKQKLFDPSKISKTKKSMSYLEWYMKNSLEEAGYYDKYKTRRSRSRDEIASTENLIKHHRTLKLFWKRTVTEVENLPWKEGRTRRKRLLYAATNYRRMVEPLDIAEYYGRGKRNYVLHGRSEHYKLLEKWLTGENTQTYQRSQASSLTVDSCFWAYVEEAMISCQVLKDGQSSSPQDQESARENLIKFEQYVMDMVNNFLVSPEIFLSQSSFMLWWNEYSKVVGNSYTSPLTNFMNDGFRRYA